MAACVNANVRGQYSNLLLGEQTDAQTQICCYMTSTVGPLCEYEVCVAKIWRKTEEIQRFAGDFKLA